MELPLLRDILILMACSALVVFILQNLKLPSILGFLITGIIIGPYGLSLVKAVHEVEMLSEIGVILLLFVIGMELSLKQLVSIRKTVFFGGFLQVGLTIGVSIIIYLFQGFSWNEAVFIGFLYSLSSTAIVLKILQDRNEINTPHGRNALGILIFQDLIVVPMMLVTPILAGHTPNVWEAVGGLFVKSILVIVLTYVSAQYLVPRLMYLVAKTKSKELFLLTTITICFAAAFLTSEAGLSLALGAFIAGLIISESEYSHQATSTILPFRELFTSFFFISVGMLLDLAFFIEHIGVILLVVLIVFVVKGSLAAIAAAFLSYPPRTVLLTGLALFQVGEFSFILAELGMEYQLLTSNLYQYFLSISILTMMLTPFVLLYSDRISSWVINSKMQKTLTLNAPPKMEEDQMHSSLDDHLLIIGFGINGRNVARAARYANIPYVIIEMNADTVRQEKAKGEPIVYGDAIHEHILDHVQLGKARVVVIAISDAHATKTIVSNIREISQSVHIVVRTRYVKEIDTLLSLGADEVIPEEFETSIEIFSRVLNNFLIPMDELETFVDAIRADNYKVFRPQKREPSQIINNINPELKIMCIRVLADSGDIVGKPIEESNIRKEYGINILAISRKNKMIHAVMPEEKILQNDRLYVSGEQEQIEDFYQAVT